MRNYNGHSNFKPFDGGRWHMKPVDSLRQLVKNNLVHRPLPGYVQLIGIRGILGKAHNRWNDALCLVSGSEVHCYCATTDPGLPRNPNPKGVAWLMAGRPYLFTFGDHKPNRPALVQAEPFVVLRYPLGKTPFDYVTAKSDGPAYFGINIHDAEPVDRERVNGWSEGCIAIRKDDGYEEFLDQCGKGKLGWRDQVVFSLRLVNWKHDALKTLPKQLMV